MTPAAIWTIAIPTGAPAASAIPSADVSAEFRLAVETELVGQPTQTPAALLALSPIPPTVFVPASVPPVGVPVPPLPASLAIEPGFVEDPLKPALPAAIEPSLPPAAAEAAPSKPRATPQTPDALSVAKAPATERQAPATPAREDRAPLSLPARADEPRAAKKAKVTEEKGGKSAARPAEAAQTPDLVVSQSIDSLAVKKAPTIDGETTPVETAGGGQIAIAASAPAAAALTPNLSVGATTAPSDSSLAALPAALPAQSTPHALPPVTTPAPAPLLAAVSPTVVARPGRIGRDMGVEIARRVAAGGDELTIRLDPAELGRVQVRLSFDEHGSLRAILAADSPVALDMLRRDAAELGRALTGAGVQSDAQSFRFDDRGGDAGQSGGRQARSHLGEKPGSYSSAPDSEPSYRPLRQSGMIDLMA